MILPYDDDSHPLRQALLDALEPTYLRMSQARKGWHSACYLCRTSLADQPVLVFLVGMPDENGHVRIGVCGDYQACLFRLAVSDD